MNIYENIIILNASLTDEEIEAAAAKVKALITNSGGEILKADNWGRKKLAYEIKKHKKGFYLLLIFKAAPSLIKKLEDYYKVFDPVIKFMVIRLDKKAFEVVMPKQEEPVPAHAAGTEQKAEQKAELQNEG